MNSSKKVIRVVISAALAASMLLPSAFALYPATVKADALYLRQSPGGAIITTLPQNTTLAVIDNSSEWYQVVVNGKEGYVSGAYLAGSPNCDFTIGSGKVVCDTIVNLREQPNMSAKILSTMPNGASVSAVGVENGWYKVVYNGVSGYMHPDYLVLSASENSGVAGAVTNTAATGLSTKRAEVLAYAAQFLGTPYVYGGSTPSGFDCSGFTSYVMKNTITSIPRVAQDQFDNLTRVSRSELLPGDLVFFGSSAYSISHVGLYVGDNQFIHAPHTGDVVKYDSLTGTYDTRFQGGARVIFD